MLFQPDEAGLNNIILQTELPVQIHPVLPVTAMQDQPEAETIIAGQQRQTPVPGHPAKTIAGHALSILLRHLHKVRLLLQAAVVVQEPKAVVHHLVAAAAGLPVAVEDNTGLPVRHDQSNDAGPVNIPPFSQGNAFANNPVV